MRCLFLGSIPHLEVYCLSSPHFFQWLLKHSLNVHYGSPVHSPILWLEIPFVPCPNSEMSLTHHFAPFRKLTDVSCALLPIFLAHLSPAFAGHRCSACLSLSAWGFMRGPGRLLCHSHMCGPEL